MSATEMLLIFEKVGPLMVIIAKQINTKVIPVSCKTFTQKEKTIYIFQNNNDAKDIENVISTKIEKAIIRGNGIDINYFSYTNRNIEIIK